jgi:hypothetical protein
MPYHDPVFPTCVGITPQQTDGEERQERSSPPAWGSPLIRRPLRPGRPVFPTCVGITPCYDVGLTVLRESSPPAWGSPVGPGARFLGACVFPTSVGIAPVGGASSLASASFPTRVGITPWPRGISSRTARLPHPRGDCPKGQCAAAPGAASSPPAWGLPLQGHSRTYPALAFPTPVGHPPGNYRTVLTTPAPARQSSPSQSD